MSAERSLTAAAGDHDCSETARRERAAISAEARRQLEVAGLDADLAKLVADLTNLVAEAPPLSSQTRDELALLFRTSSAFGGEAA